MTLFVAYDFTHKRGLEGSGRGFDCSIEYDPSEIVCINHLYMYSVNSESQVAAC